MIRDKLSFLTLIGLQVQSAVENRVQEYRATYEAHVARLQVSPPRHSSTLHHRTFIHYGTDVLSCQTAVSYPHHYTVRLAL